MRTKVCKLCFKDYYQISLLDILDDSNCICKQCYKEIVPVFKQFDVDGYKAVSIYGYTPKIQSLLFQFKGCFDIEIGNVFLERYRRELRFRYIDYVLVPIPSFKDDDENRGFNHVIEMFKILKLPMIDLIEKTKQVKQATSSSKERIEISKYLQLKNRQSLKKKNVLIVDDVYTTGATMKAAIKLVEQLNPKKIEILVMSKTELN